MTDSEDPRRRLPGVDVLLEHGLLREFAGAVRQEIIVSIIRERLAEARDRITRGKSPASVNQIAAEVAKSLRQLSAPSIKRVINATGVILHTGLGRAPLAKQALQSANVAAGYCNLEFDLATGNRGDRQDHLRHLLCRLTGAEDALVVNNNAAAVYLSLNTLAHKKEVIVSRGQLIEIGGSFRLPDIMKRAGVKLIEVGATNRTRIADFREAISSRTALLLRAYPSNYRIEGFTESVTIRELSELARETDTIVVDDLGGGLLWDWTEFGLPYEPNVKESLQSGADLVLVSGDKVLGGPQAGIILGKRDLVKKLAKSPLARVLRTDKLTVAALSTTLREYLHPSEYREYIPAWRMLTSPAEVLKPLADSLYQEMSKMTNWEVLEIQQSIAEAGSGTLPAEKIPSLAICCLPEGWTCSKWAKALRTATTPVVGTIRNDRLSLDLRTIQPDEADLLIQSLREVTLRGRS